MHVIWLLLQYADYVTRETFNSSGSNNDLSPPDGDKSGYSIYLHYGGKYSGGKGDNNYFVVIELPTNCDIIFLLLFTCSLHAHTN